MIEINCNNIKPVGDKVLIEKDKVDASDQYETSSGILVVNSNGTRHQGRFSLGTIKAIGTEFLNEYKEVVKISDVMNVGDRILYYHPSEVPITDSLVMVRAIDIDCIVTDSSNLGRLGSI